MSEHCSETGPVNRTSSSPDTSSMMYVEIAVFAPLSGTFTYLWPDFLGQAISGIRVEVPFGRGKRIGVIMQFTMAAPDDQDRYKTVLDRLDATALFTPSRSQWLQRIGRYYLAQPGELWGSALGWANQHDMRRFRCADLNLLKEQSPLLSELFLTRAAISLKTILQRSKKHNHGMRYQIHQACEKAWLEEVSPDPLWEQSSKKTDKEADQKAEKVVNQSDRLEAKTSITYTAPTATENQQEAINSIIKALDKFQSFLLFGCTGSGKTEVYLRAAEAVIAHGGQVLVLVPEIGLTPLWLARLRQRFKRVALWHSAMTPKERLVVRQHLHNTDILIGTRSALFLPLPKLALLVVDEEHDASFKQQDGMAYSARDMAVLLAQELNIPIVLGSATPSLESWRQVKSGAYQRLDLPHRIASHQAPIASKVIDMRLEDGPVSKSLFAALQHNLENDEQSILFLNRRGYSPALQCTACGDVPECHACSMRLTLHRRAGQLRCHSCGFRRRVPKTCECCGEIAFLPLGEGTEKLEEWLASHIPALRFSRFDRDVITSHARLEKTLTEFEQGELDCLIGTQMLVKGHDFPNVTLVGVINADLGVSMPDFRAGERWWQQMTQVTGRAGRGHKAGQVIIQTRMPEAEWFQRISESQAESTMDDELLLREQLSFPPFARWVRLVFSARALEQAIQSAQQCVSLCQSLEEINISGPMPCPMERVAGKYRIEVLLRDASRKLLPWKLETILAAMPATRDVRIRIDVDPQDMM